MLKAAVAYLKQMSHTESSCPILKTAVICKKKNSCSMLKNNDPC